MQEPQFVEWTIGRFHAFFLSKIVESYTRHKERYERID